MNDKRILKVAAGVVAGNAIIAFAVAAFVLPHGLITGGATGISLALSKVLHLNLSVVLFGVNIALFLLGALMLGRKFALTTIVSTAVYPVFLSFFREMQQLQNITDNVLLSTIYAGLILGLGIGLVIRMGASTGGTDILALVLQKKIHIPVAVCLYVLDFIILAAQALSSTGEQILYGILALLLTTIVLGRITLFGKAQIQLMIVSKEYEQLRKILLEELDVGVTMIHIETGYDRQLQQGIMCVISNRRLYAVNEVIQKIDKEAFITVTHINEVRGRGFSISREYLSDRN